MTTPPSAWMCHVCDYRSTVGEGQVCSQCYRICCSQHINKANIYNPASGLYEPALICVECQFKETLR